MTGVHNRRPERLVAREVVADRCRRPLSHDLLVRREVSQEALWVRQTRRTSLSPWSVASQGSSRRFLGEESAADHALPQRKRPEAMTRSEAVPPTRPVRKGEHNSARSRLISLCSSPNRHYSACGGSTRHASSFSSARASPATAPLESCGLPAREKSVTGASPTPGRCQPARRSQDHSGANPGVS